MPRRKKILILWSGGVDSTALVDKLIKEGHEVYTGYIQLDNNNDKAKMELAAIERLVGVFSKNKNYTHRGTIAQVSINNVSTSLWLKQPLIWLLSAIYSGLGMDEVAIAYVMNDDAVSYLPEMQKIWNSYKFLSSEKIPKLVFPFIKYRKRDLWDGLDPELKQYVVWCESPTYSPEQELITCGVCDPCKRHKDLIPNNDTEVVPLTDTVCEDDVKELEATKV